MHRSYRVQGAVQIIRYANRIEIRNPGHSLVAEDRLGEPGSETRNPVIAAILHETNLAETKGSGIRVMRELMTDSGLTPPAFESDRERNQFIVTFLFHHFLTPEDWNWLRQFGELGLSDEEARALVFIRELGAINNAAYRNLSRVDALNASQHLRRLRDHGLLQQKGKGSETYYVPTPKMLASWRAPVVPGADPGQPAQSLKPPNESVNPQPLSGNPPAQSVNLPPQSVNQVHRYAAFPGLPPHLENALASLKARVSQPEMQDLVWQLCAWKALATDELAALLNRNRTYVTNRLVTPMLRAGRLEMTIPDQPNHPDQRYRAITK